MKFKTTVLFIFSFFLAPGGFCQSVSTPVRTVTKIGDGIYVIRHRDAPDGNPQGNTTVVIGTEKVIVVDACYLPSSAQEDIDQIKTWTSKPVNILINTHWHADHQQGNAVYLKAYPDIMIIAHSETAREMLAFESKDLVRYTESFAVLKKQVETGKNDSGTPFNTSDLKNMKELYVGQDSVMKEMNGYKPAYPNLRINGDMDIEDGNETVQIKYLGPVHTIGDIEVYLPKEKILVTGDVIATPIPYFFGGGYPYQGLQVLKAIDKMDISTLVPGHGGILKDKAYLNQEINLIEYVITHVRDEVYKEGLFGIKIENVEKAIDLTDFRKQFTKGLKENEEYFDASIVSGLVGACFEQMAK
jgi:glyoxylase-like metal-dependent hydrolase (beta-lactamase superfamily II)